MRRPLMVLPLWSLLLMSTTPATAQGPSHDAPVVVPTGAEEVWALDTQRRAALLAGDLTTLESFCADELTYSHTNGMVDTKTSYLKSLRSGVRYVKMDLSHVNIAQFDTTVVMTGVAQIAVKSPNGDIGFKARFTNVWAKQKNRWRFVAWHTTKMPD